MFEMFGYSSPPPLVPEEEPCGHLVCPPPMESLSPVPQLVEMPLAGPSTEQVQVAAEQVVIQQQPDWNRWGVAMPGTRELYDLTRKTIKLDDMVVSGWDIHYEITCMYLLILGCVI